MMKKPGSGLCPEITIHGSNNGELSDKDGIPLVLSQNWEMNQSPMGKTQTGAGFMVASECLLDDNLIAGLCLEEFDGHHTCR